MPRTFHLDPSVTALMPELRVGVIIASGFDNRRSGEQSAALLAQAAEQVRQRVGDAEIPSLPEIAPWREAYRAFGVKPSKYRSSIESLYRSAAAGSLRSINPLVNLYNVVSLQAGSPCGGEDLAALDGDIHLTRATGAESFIPLGMMENQPPIPGEIIYRDETGAFCRCLNWREADRTKLTEETTNAILCMEVIDPARIENIQHACEELAALIETHLGGTTVVRMVTPDRPSVSFRLPPNGPVIEK
jgi:DNA/RNA-binding domain of Phe-tRNA-synthetase-like protein